jgi:hypothetical protein
MLTLESFALCLAFGAGLAALTLVDGIFINGMTQARAV